MGKLNLSNQPLKGRKNKFGYALKTIKVCGYSCCLIRRGREDKHNYYGLGKAHERYAAGSWAFH